MLNVYHSNRLEALFILLCSLRESRPMADPLAPETILVANPGIGRWLSFQIADRTGIAANIEYVQPATFVWQLYRSCLNNVPEKSAFERNALSLRILSQLEQISGASDTLWLPLQRYTSADSGTIGDTKRVQLASRIADVFDQYLVYRPQMLLDWEKGANTTPGDDPAQQWQPALWRRLVESVNQPHRAALWQQFCTLADRGNIDPALLPPQLHLFNVGLLPPSTLDVLVRLGTIGDSGAERVSMYFLNPAIDYWADLVDMRRAARQRLKLGTPDNQADHQPGNSLLSSLGSSGRMLMKLLGDRSEWVHDEQFFLPAASDNLLAAVQAGLLHPFAGGDQNNSAVPSASSGNACDMDGDESIQLHQCYSPVREVQALHDRLLDRFNADDSLTPADVIVMVPDINTYAPVIEAVFGSVGGEPDNPDRTRHIPWSIADRSLTQVAQIIDCIQRLFELPGFEFEATGVISFAAEPAIARRFGFDDNALETISEWLQESGVRRTLAGEHETLLQQPSAALHSWDFGIRRLLLGRAMPADGIAVKDVLPSTRIDGQQAQLLSQLLNLLTALEETRARLTEARPPAEWVDAINDMITRLILPDESEADALMQLSEMLNEIDTDAISAGHTEAMTHATFAEILRGTLAGAQRKNHRYLTGRVTFSSMVPLRSVPFRIVCMLGLNDGDFPRQRPNPGFDLMAQQPLPGDRSVRDDDRYLFLEALLSARDELYLSWIYHNLADNAPREPSVLVSELRDYLDKHHPQQPPRCVAHPLQSFSPLLFNPHTPALHTFASEWAPPLNTPAVVTLTATGLPTEPDAHIAVDDFQTFWRNPSKWYCRRVLGLALWYDEQEPQDAEPFDGNGLHGYMIRDTLIRVMLQQPSLDQAQAQSFLKQRAALPHGGLGQLVFETAFDEAQDIVQRINDQNYTAITAIEISITVNNQQLQGRLRNGVKHPDGRVGLLQFHASKLKGNHLCSLWLAHLIGSAAGELTGPSLLISKDQERAFAAIEQESALAKLQPWFEGWNTGQESAVPFFANTSALLAGALKGHPNSAWLTSFNGLPGESEEEAIRLLYPSTTDVIQRPDVIDLANQLLGDEGLTA